MPTVVVFAGEYDLVCKEELRRELDPLANERTVVLDFTEVTFIDSTSLTELIRLQRARSERGLSPLTIVLKSENPIRRLFTIAGVDTVFRLCDCLDQAVKKNGETTQVRYAFSGSFETEPAPLEPMPISAREAPRFHRPGP